MSSVHSISHRQITRPLRTTFSTSLGRKDAIKSVIVRVTLDDGSSGLGECPTSFTLKKETVPAIKGIISDAASRLRGLPIGSYEDEIDAFRRRYPANPMTVSGLEVALFRAHLQSRGLKEHEYWGGKTAEIETDITIPFLADMPTLRAWVKYAASKRFTTFKLKVSGDVRQDEKLLTVVMDSLRAEIDRITLRLDGNQGYTTQGFRRMADFIEKSGYAVECFEQPLPKADYKGMKKIKKDSPIPIILDETIFTAADLEHALSEDLCHGVNIKIAKSGIRESKKIFGLAKRHGLKLMIGCMTETMVGLSAGIFLAAGTAGFDYIDLDSIHLLHHKNHYDGITIKGPMFTVA